MPDTFVSNPSFFKLDATLKKLRNYWQKTFDDLEKDITVDQWLLLENLHKHKKITHNELARLTSKDITTVSRIIELMVRKELVIREGAVTDRRKVFLQLTEKGNEKYKEVRPIVLDMRKKGWKGLTERDYEELTRILDTIYVNMS
ncbi:MarR family winged helix-turn-helix transcriptional regulator [Chitinophaga pendula]|uniref:MarR family winged helix-turn-helix transcriptional regulator n=1 Tax=Chitinophaga TaxID=79328 RepID=UPI000BAEBF2F|nr:MULTISPECIES: MarR family winged helix-turn-helix transcriptional regulator [Chitinophaga]ASZ11170.1 MarR family transcriptional regulator [Chitinophaga sp. MD30]UCJ05833.1 MarR family winged helix-turn-helix transcriptional regulator [Chitinophaga pendula]